MNDVYPVVVVGAGPTGVTAATLLAKRGVKVLVLDRWAGVFPQPRAVHLDDEIYRILGQLGVAGEFAHISRPSQGLRLMDARHRVYADFRRNQENSTHGYPQANMFDQPDLEILLRENMQLQPTITFRGDVDVTDVRQADESLVQIELTDRSTGARETVEAQYVLGCDGANSIVRESIGATMRDLNFEQRWLVVDVNTDHDLGQWEGVHQVCDTDRAATYMRIGDRRYRWEFQLNDNETSGDFASMQRLQPLLEPWTGTTPSTDLEVVRVAEYTFRARLADRWRDRNIFILGDAAHLTPPFIGQGMGAGMRDAANLAWKLAAVVDGTLPSTALDSYEVERRPHAQHMIRLAMTVGTLMTRGGRAGDVLRRLIAPRLHLIPGLRDKLVDSRTPPLHASTLVGRRRRKDRLAGTLCPNALIDDSHRFDDFADGRFALVTAEPVPMSNDVAVLAVQPGEPLHEWLTRARAKAAIVRPDGTVLSSEKHVDNAVDRLALVSAGLGEAQ
jgi:3-(3-hydroxy-phenyl)propionate hydroxylase